MENSIKNNILTFIEEIKAKIYNLIFFDTQQSFVGSSIQPNKPEIFTIARLEEIVASTLSILSKVYGEENQHVKDFMEKNTSYRRHTSDPYQKLFNCCIGKLNAVESDIKFGILETIEREVSGEVFSDFIKAAKSSFDEGYKEIAAVLGCAALEDLLKRLAKLNSVEVDDKTMADVVNALKRGGIIKGAQTNLISAYVTLRNKTFHAQWDKIENADIKSLIGFTEEMLIKHFS
jgi:uncharacterized protein YutE (UPF0331/DUF86 family)